MFNVDFTFLWTLVNLLILFFFLRKVLFKRVGDFIKKRAANLAEEHDRAEKDRVEAKAMLERYKEKLHAADAESDAIVKQARSVAAAEAERITANAKLEAERIIAAARQQIASEQQSALIAFKTQAAALTLAAASRILRRSINTDDDKQFAEKVLREIAAGPAEGR